MSRDNNPVLLLQYTATIDPLSLNFTPQTSILLATYSLIVITLALFGNGTVLYASMQYNRFQVDGISLLFMQNLVRLNVMLFKVIFGTFKVVAR